MGLEVGVEEGVGLGAEAGGVRAGVERGGPRLDQRRLGLEHLEVARGPLAAEADRDGVGALGLGHEPVAVEGDLGDGRIHSAPLMWAEALDLLLQTLKDQGHDLSEIDAIAGSGQQHGTVYLNNTAAPALQNISSAFPLKDQLAGIFSRDTTPIWMDTSTSAQCAEIEDGVGGQDKLLELTGNTAFERFSGPQIRKFYETEPEAYASTHTIHLVSSYMATLLVGEAAAIDTGDGAGMNLMDLARKTWARWF